MEIKSHLYALSHLSIITVPYLIIIRRELIVWRIAPKLLFMSRNGLSQETRATILGQLEVVVTSMAPLILVLRGTFEISVHYFRLEHLKDSL